MSRNRPHRHVRRMRADNHASTSAADKRSRELMQAHGWRLRTVREWLDRWAERPELLDDLLRVIYGTPQGAIAMARRRQAQLQDAGRLPKYAETCQLCSREADGRRGSRIYAPLCERCRVICGGPYAAERLAG